MVAIHARQLPEGALLDAYRQAGTYTDCWTTDVAHPVALADLVTAFYTTPLFKIERAILRWAVRKPSGDAQVTALAAGTIDTFAAWHVEARAPEQLLMCDFRGRTRSWLMVSPGQSASGPMTRLYFGSAVVPVANWQTGRLELGGTFTALLGIHKIYSILLLRAAAAGLNRRARAR